MLPVATIWDRGRHGWYVRFVRDGRRRGKKVGPPGPVGEKKARDWVKAYEARTEREKMWDRGPAPLPISELVTTWRTRHAALRSKRTQITDSGLVKRIAQHFGGLDARELTNERIAEFAASVIAGDKSGHTAANALSLLRRAVNLAVGSGLLERNPVTEWATVMRQARTRTSEAAETRDAWTREEAGAMLELARARESKLTTPLLAAFHTGMRRGELLALRWEDVDFAKRRIQIRRTVEAGKGHSTKPPKAGRGRMMPLSETLADALLAHRKTQRRARLKGKPDEMGRVFLSPEGRPWGERNFARSWERLRHRFDGIRALPFHCTRHTFITWALEANTPIKQVSEWTGVSVAIIEKHYAHAIPEGRGVAFLDARNMAAQDDHTHPQLGTAHSGDPGRI